MEKIIFKILHTFEKGGYIHVCNFIICITGKKSPKVWKKLFLKFSILLNKGGYIHVCTNVSFASLVRFLVGSPLGAVAFTV
jgi:hypothetical protein